MKASRWKAMTLAALLLGGFAGHAMAASVMGTPVVWLKSDGTESTTCAITNLSAKNLGEVTLTMKGDSNITVVDVNCSSLVPGATCYTPGFTGTGQRRCVATGVKAKLVRMALNKCNSTSPFECKLVVEGR